MDHAPFLMAPNLMTALLVLYVAWGQVNACKKPFLSVFSCMALPHTLNVFSLSALVITDTELKLMAAAAMIGLNRMPNTG